MCNASAMSSCPLSVVSCQLGGRVCPPRDNSVRVTDRRKIQIRIRGILALFVGLLFITGCASDAVHSRPFNFATDTFAYRNELVWEYHYAPGTRETTVSRREPKPDYTQRCFVVSRAARQFFDHATFDPSKPACDTNSYRRLVHEVMARSAKSPRPERTRVVIPGYADLRSFSRDWEQLLKAESGGAWRSYLQCGNWRMILPFTRGQQERTAEAMARRLQSRPQIAHLVRFPDLSINHALLVYDSRPSETGRTFLAYDPNDNQQPVELIFDTSRRSFFLGPNEYFAGGDVNVYPAYHGFCY
jgi:hypothetical protein